MSNVAVLKQLEDMATRATKRLPSLLYTANEQKMYARQQHNMNRMDAQVDANLKKCNPDYEAPAMEDEDMSILNNGVFIGDDTINKIINAENKSISPGPKPWWKWLLSLLIGAGLILLALYLYLLWFPPTDGKQPIYSIITEPWTPPQ